MGRTIKKAEGRKCDLLIKMIPVSLNENYT